jgi:CRP-like cAMP-binding protein
MYRKVLACEANHFESCINIGICMMKLNLHHEAIQSFDSAIKSKKVSFVPYYNKALSFIAVQNFAAALQCMDTASNLFPDPPEELQKIRTFAIFKSGKVSSAISNSEGKESPITTRAEYRTFSPVEEISYEKPERILRRMTMQPSALPQVRNMVEHHESPIRKLTIVQDFDSRGLKTASGFNVNERSEISSSSSSPYKTVTTRQSPFQYSWKKYLPQEFFVPKGNFPLNVSELELENCPVRDQTVLKRVREKLKSLEDKLIEFIAKNLQKAFLMPKFAHRSEITQDEVNFLLEKFSPEKDLQKIDFFLKNLDFFQDIPETFRQRVYQVSKIEKFEKNSKIFIQGNVASKYFLLLKGKVNSIVDSEKSEMNSTTEYLRYARSLTSDKKFYVSLENLANCIADEVTYALTFPTYEYQQIFSDLLKHNIEERVCFLVTLPLFKGIDPTNLIPLAWHLQVERYQEGQVIQQKYSVPKGLTIIYTGYCGIYTTGFQKRAAIGSEFANIKKRQPKPASFYTGNLKYPIRRNDFSLSSKDSRRNKSSTYKTVEKIEHGLLRYGDYFGGRVLLDHKYQDLTSKYTIIAETKDVQVFVISRQSMQNLQEKLVVHLKTVIQKSPDIDCPPAVDPELMDTQFNDWQKYKLSIVDNIQRKAFVDSKKIEFPYLR